MPGAAGDAEGPVFSCEDMEFLATWEEVTIIPNFTGNRISCICGEFGPFMPSIPSTVPLFLALEMKQSHKCRIQPPDWIDKKKLEDVLEQELKTPDQALDLTELQIPFHYSAIAHLLLQHASDDISIISEVHDCRRLLRDIEDVRQSKIRKGTKLVMDMVKDKDHVHEVSKAINFRNLVFSELNQLRPSLLLALDTLDELNPRAAVANDDGAAAFGASAQAAGSSQAEEDGPKRKLRRFRK